MRDTEKIICLRLSEVRERDREQRLQLLDKRIGGTIYWPFIAMNEGFGGGGVPYWSGGRGAEHMPHWMQKSTDRWLYGCVSSFNNRRPWSEKRPENGLREDQRKDERLKFDRL